MDLSLRSRFQESYRNSSDTLSLNHSQPVSGLGGGAFQLRRNSTLRKSLGTSKSESSSGPSFSSTTSEPQVEKSTRCEPSACVISLRSVVVTLTGKPVSTPVR